jgi:hypothetical protein
MSFRTRCGIQNRQQVWIPVFTGMTKPLRSLFSAKLQTIKLAPFDCAQDKFVFSIPQWCRGLTQIGFVFFKLHFRIPLNAERDNWVYLALFFCAPAASSFTISSFRKSSYVDLPTSILALFLQIYPCEMAALTPKG